MRKSAAYAPVLLVLATLAACNPSPKITQDAPTTPTSVSTSAIPVTATAATPKEPSAKDADAAPPENGVAAIRAMLVISPAAAAVIVTIILIL